MNSRRNLEYLGMPIGSMHSFKGTPGRPFGNAHLGTGGGDAPSAPTNTTQNVNSVPDFIQPYVESMLGKTQALTNDVNYTPYDPTQRFAGPTDLQTQSYDALGNMVPASQITQGTDAANTAIGQATQAGAASPGLMSAALGFGQGAVATGAQLGTQMQDPNAVGSYMSPYMQNVVDTQKAEAVRDYQKQLPTMQAAATQAGSFGGSREAIMAAEGQRNLNTQLGNIQATGSQNAYTAAMQNLQAANAAKLSGYTAGISGVGQGINAGQLGVQAANTGITGANTLGVLGNTNYNQQLGIAQAQNAAGTQQQTQDQQRKDFNYQQYQDELQYPYKQLGFMSDMTRGLPLSQTTQTQTTAPPNQTSQLIGAGIAAYGALNRAQGGIIPAPVRNYAAGGQVDASGEGGGQPDGAALEQLPQSDMGPMLAKLTDQQLAAYAGQVKDALTLGMIKREISRRAAMRAPQGQMPSGTVAQEVSQQADPQPVQAGIAAMAPPDVGQGSAQDAGPAMADPRMQAPRAPMASRMIPQAVQKPMPVAAGIRGVPAAAPRMAVGGIVGYAGGGTPAIPGLITPGNINLDNRPIVRNNDGSYSTVRSVSFGTDKGEVLVPSVNDDGYIMSDKEAQAQYAKTGNHLGIFKDPASADAYAKALHNQQAQEYGDRAGTPGSYMQQGSGTGGITGYAGGGTPRVVYSATPTDPGGATYVPATTSPIAPTGASGSWAPGMGASGDFSADPNTPLTPAQQAAQAASDRNTMKLGYTLPMDATVGAGWNKLLAPGIDAVRNSRVGRMLGIDGANTPVIGDGSATPFTDGRSAPTAPVAGIAAVPPAGTDVSSFANLDAQGAPDATGSASATDPSAPVSKDMQKTIAKATGVGPASVAAAKATISSQPDLPAPTDFASYIKQITDQLGASDEDKEAMKQMEAGVSDQQARVNAQKSRTNSDALIALGTAMMQGRTLGEGISLGAAAGAAALQKGDVIQRDLEDKAIAAKDAQLKFEIAQRSGDADFIQKALANYNSNKLQLYTAVHNAQYQAASIAAQNARTAVSAAANKTSQDYIRMNSINSAVDRSPDAVTLGKLQANPIGVDPNLLATLQQRIETQRKSRFAAAHLDHLYTPNDYGTTGVGAPLDMSKWGDPKSRSAVQ